MMLSRKQQMRRICGRSRDHCTHTDHPVCHRQWIPNDSRSHVPRDAKASLQLRSEKTTNCQQEELNRTNCEARQGVATTPWNSGVPHSAEATKTSRSVGNKRSVRFNETIRVLPVVPTRKELKAEECENHQELWWSAQDCLEFRKSFAKKLHALEISTHFSVLNPTIVMLLDASDENEDNAVSTAEKKVGRSTADCNAEMFKATVPQKLTGHRVLNACRPRPSPHMSPAVDTTVARCRW